MTENATRSQEGIDLEPRDLRALEEYITVLDRDPQVRDRPGQYLVVSESGKTYTVDAMRSSCDCPDHEYRDVRCKHIRRVQFATGVVPVPADVDIAGNLGEHVQKSPTFADALESETESAAEPTPETDGGQEAETADGCMCDGLNITDTGDELPCFECFRARESEPVVEFETGDKSDGKKVAPATAEDSGKEVATDGGVVVDSDETIDSKFGHNPMPTDRIFESHKPIGVDSEGRIHHFVSAYDREYVTEDGGQIYVVDPETGLEHVEYLGDRSPTEWVRFIDQDLGGWDTLWMVTNDVSILEAAGLGGGDR